MKEKTAFQAIGALWLIGATLYLAAVGFVLWLAYTLVMFVVNG